MFLKRMSPSKGDRGSAIIGVLGVMGVSGVIALTITTMSLHAVGYSTSTRASVQAEAAAEAGIDYAAANLATGVCQSQYSSSSAPIFAVTIAYSTLPTSPGDTDTSWVSGCSSSAQRLKLVSTGWASALGVAGNSSGNVRRVEAIYPYTPSPPPNAIIPSGASLYSFAQTDLTMQNLTITQASTTRPSIEYLSGSTTCTSSTTIMGDVILGNGALTVNGCIINGDLWASNTVSMQSGEITGNVNAAGVQSGTSVSLSSSAIVDGNIFAAGPVSISGKVGGNVVAGPTSGTSTFANKSSVGGSVISAGTISANGVIKGTISTNQSGIVTPTIPLVPPWVDYAYKASDWVTSSGAPYALLTMTACDASTLANSQITVKNSTTPIIWDTRICGAVTPLGGADLILKSDTVIIANGFSLSWGDIESSDTNDKRLWIIIPDTVPGGQPTCPTNSSATIANHVTVGSHVGAMLYSPCPISNHGDVWRGQIYSSSTSSSTGFTLNFLPIGLPTVNLSTGQFLPPPGTGVLGDRTSIRDLAVG